MAYGIEIVLGWTENLFSEVAKAGIGAPVTNEDWEEAESRGYDDYLWKKSAGLAKEIAEHAKNVQLTMLVAMGMKKVPWKSGTFSQDLVMALPPDGRERGFRRASIGFHYDPYEMGDERKDAVIGISLVTRYSPCLLDWEHEHGGSGSKFVLEEDVLKTAGAFQYAMTAAFPVFGLAKLIVVQCHY